MTNETTASERERFEAALAAANAVARGCIDDGKRHDIIQTARNEWNRRAALPAPADQVLVPKRLTRAMREVLDEEGWTWEDLLAAAEAITEAEHAELQAAPADQPTSQEPQGSSGSLSELRRTAQVAEAAWWCKNAVRHVRFVSIDAASSIDDRAAAVRAAEEAIDKLVAML